MLLFKNKIQKPDKFTHVLVKCPHFCESGYEICEVNGSGKFISQGNGDDMTEDVHGWTYLTPNKDL